METRMNLIPMSATLMRDYVNTSNLVVTKQYDGLMLLKYKRKVFFDNLWDRFLVECRGTVVDQDFNVIQRPFTKIFNYGENNTRIHRDTIVNAVRKVNGFMAALTCHDGKILVTTTGSFDSPFTAMATEMLAKTGAFMLASEMPTMTFIFEIVHPDDPHIIPEEIGCWLLGARRKEWDVSNHGFHQPVLDGLADQYNLKRPNWFRMRFSDIMDISRTVQHEGFVCYTENGEELKLKSPYYLTTKFFARKTVEKLNDLIDNPIGLKQSLDEEFYPVVDYIVQQGENFTAKSEQQRLSMMRAFVENGGLTNV